LSTARTSVAPTPSQSTPSQSTPSTPQTSSTPPLPAGQQVLVTEGRPLLGVTAGWELFGRGDGVLVRIQPAAGRITRTAIPALQSGGPVYLVAGTDRVVIRPLDNVPGYVVPDGKPAQQLPAVFDQEGPAFPGPAPDQMWVRPSDDHEPVMALARVNGSRLAYFIVIPRESPGFDAIPDGAGYLLFPGIGGFYDARPDGLHRITTGALLAVGPTGWLVSECDERYRCHVVLIGRVDGSRRVVNTESVVGSLGVISPDGSTAALRSTDPNGATGLYLLDLASGRRRVINLLVSQEFYEGSNLAFSPDSTWLFAASESGELSAVNRRTGAVTSLATRVPPLSEIVIRPAAGHR